MSLYNLRNPAVKRLMREAEELRCPTNEYHAQPLEDNLFEWHFTLIGPPNTEFDGGIYHGKITLPPDYPMKPPSIILLTPNGRFETNKKICLSISGYHPESWQPSWSIRTALLAIIGFLPTHANGAIGSLDYTPEERKELALKSQEWQCPQCGDVKKFLSGREKETSATSPQISNVKIESIIEQETPSSSGESHKVVNTLKDFVCEENTSNNFQSDVQETPKEISIPSAPSLSLQKEALLRHRQRLCSLENIQKAIERNEARPVSGNLSLGVIWVICFLLGILILRRLLSE